MMHQTVRVSETSLIKAPKLIRQLSYGMICHSLSGWIRCCYWRQLYPRLINRVLKISESPGRKVHYGTYYNLTITPTNKNLYEEDFMLKDPKWVIADHLSNKTRGSVTIRLPFDFPFFGHNHTKFFLTTEGFISLADRLHSEVAHNHFKDATSTGQKPTRQKSTSQNNIKGVKSSKI